MQTWTVDGESMRLDVYLAWKAAWSRIRVRDAVRGGAVMVNGRIARKAALVIKAGDVVELRDDGIPMTETRLAAMDLHLPVLYEDAHCLVLNKPAGIPVHPGAGIPADAPTILHGIVHLFAERGIPFSSAAVLVHRLDKDTTGCLLVAKSAPDHKALQRQFAERTIGKTYLALVAGRPQPASAIIDAPIGRHATERTKMSMTGTAKTREAKTTYRTLASGPDASLLQCDLHTGRTHQLRVHLAGIGSPILGDPTYATTASDALSARLGIHELRLHAWKLSFQDPETGKDIGVTAPLAGPFVEALGRAEIDASAVPH
jgi:23S rRNA pseudouridine1911/1915/1917 synthase